MEKLSFGTDEVIFREATPFARNDLGVPDGVPFQVSRNHCSVEKHGDEFFVFDRGSTVGTVVNGDLIGHQSREIAARLRGGENELILGSPEGPDHFTLTLGEG